MANSTDDDIPHDESRQVAIGLTQLFMAKRVSNPWLPGLGVYIPIPGDPERPESEFRVGWFGPNMVVAIERLHGEVFRWDYDKDEGWTVLEQIDDPEQSRHAKQFRHEAINIYKPPPHWRINIHSPASQGVLLSVLGEALRDGTWHLRPEMLNDGTQELGLVWRCCSLRHPDSPMTSCHPQPGMAVAMALITLTELPEGS